MKDDHTAAAQREALTHLKAQLAAAENRGFRAAAEWLDAEADHTTRSGISLMEAAEELRAEADRREGK